MVFPKTIYDLILFSIPENDHRESTHSRIS
jgi:hypothetical protein